MKDRKNLLSSLWKAFALPFVVAAVCGCNHQGTSLESLISGEERLTLVYGDSSEYSPTKGDVFTSNGAFAWTDGDFISLWFSDSKYRDYKVTAGGIDKPAVSAQRANYAIYPSASAPDAAEAYSGTTPYVKYPAEYPAKWGMDSMMPLVAENVEGNSELVFRHVGGLLRIKLNGVHKDTRSVEVAFSKSELTGTFAVDVTTDADNPVTKRAAGENAVGDGCTIRFSSAKEPNLVSYVSIPLPAGVYEEETITVTLYDKDNNVLAADANNESFQSTIDLGTVGRKTGRLFFMSLNGLSYGIDRVEISSQDPEKFTLSSGEGTLYLYDTPNEAQLAATVYYLPPAGSVTDNSLVNWSTSDATKVRVSPTGRITAVGLTDDAGVTITATSVDDASVSASVTIRVLAYSPVSNFTPTPFSVAADRTVEFSPGNLQATIKTDNSSENAEWQFAQYQYDYIGAHEGSSINTTAGYTIDLFDWSGAESSIDHYGIVSNGNVNHLEFVDWGNNKIDYRGSSYAAAFTYRTLTAAEWKYLLEERTGDKAGVVGVAENCRYSLVTVENVFGMIIYPDRFRWVPADMGPMPTKFNVYSPSCGSYSGANWAALENAGVVFLPAAGYRYSDNRVYGAGTSGYYWSSTPGRLNSDNMNSIGYYPTRFTFSSTDYGFHKNNYISFGAVRLVKINDGEKTNVRKVELDGITNRQLQITTGSWPTSRTITSTVHYQNTSETVAVPIKIASGMITKLTDCEDTPNSFTVSGNTLKATSYGYVVICSEDILNYNETYASDYCLVGATDGYYHLPNGKRVKLSPGNLQAKVDNNGDVEEWRFAPNPYDIIVSKDNYDYFVDGVNYDYHSNSYIISLESQFNKIYLNTTSGWIDLFEYSQENSLNNKDNNYGVYIYRGDLSEPGPFNASLSFVDWGGCRITHGGTNYDPNTWRTPTDAEWEDLTFGTSLPNRTYIPFINNDGSLTSGYSLCDVVGLGLVSRAMLLIPDGYIIPPSLTYSYNYIGPITTSSWQTFKQAGCDLIPDMMNTQIPYAHLSESYEAIDYTYEFLDQYGDGQEASIMYDSYYYEFSGARGDHGDNRRALYWLTPALPLSYAEPWVSTYKTMTLNPDFNYNSRDNTRGPYYDESHDILKASRFDTDYGANALPADDILGSPAYVRLIRVLE